MASQNIESLLYNGLHSILFKNSSHRYFIDGETKPGVTTILSKVLAKPELMLWPLNMALTFLKTKLPTITPDDLEEAKNAHVKRRDAGGNTGTIVHGIVEKILNNENVALDEQPEEVCKAVNGFTAWRDTHAPKTIATEQVVYSHDLGYAGTFDSILEINGRVYLCDLKTTNSGREAPKGIYADYFIQLGAYYLAYEEQRLYEISNGGTSLVNIDDLLIISCKKDGRVDTLSASEVGLSTDDCADLWRHTLNLFFKLKHLKNQLILSGGKYDPARRN